MYASTNQCSFSPTPSFFPDSWGLRSDHWNLISSSLSENFEIFTIDRLEISGSRGQNIDLEIPESMWLFVPDVMKSPHGFPWYIMFTRAWGQPSTFDHQSNQFFSEPKWNVCTKFEDIPSTRSWDIMFIRMGQTWRHMNQGSWVIIFSRLFVEQTELMLWGCFCIDIYFSIHFQCWQSCTLFLESSFSQVKAWFESVVVLDTWVTEEQIQKAAELHCRILQ